MALLSRFRVILFYRFFFCQMAPQLGIWKGQVEMGIWHPHRFFLALTTATLAASAPL